MVNASNERHPLACAVALLPALRRTRFLGVTIALPGERKSRESLTQDSRSAVKARLMIRYANHSATSVALVAAEDVMAFPKAITWVPTPRHAKGYP